MALLIQRQQQPQQEIQSGNHAYVMSMATPTKVAQEKNQR